MTTTRAQLTPTAGILTALDKLWQAIRVRHPDVPAVAIAIAAGHGRGNGHKLGHFAPGRWQCGDTRLDEFFVSGESFYRGSAEVLHVALHEAAHGVADARGIRDNSRQGRYHNTRYRKIAIELGLDVAEDAAGGWHVTSLPERTAAAYRRETRRLDVALTAWRYRDPVRKTGRASNNNGYSASCRCGHRVRVSAKVIKTTRIICGTCYGEFAAARCALCEMPFLPSPAGQRYCSDRCAEFGTYSASTDGQPVSA